MEQRAAAILEKYSPQLIVPRDLTAGGRAATLLFNPDITDGVTLRMTVHALTKYEGKLTSAEQAAKEVLTAAEVKIAEAKISESAAQAKDSATKQGGLRDVSIMEPVAKEAVETGKCRARVKVAFGNGSSKVETAQLIKTEKGWLVTFGL